MKMAEPVVMGTKNSGDEASGYAFFSYSRKDKLRIRDLSVFLKREELQPWIDNQLRLGEIWQEELKNKIEYCKLFVIFVSENSRNSRFVKWEIDKAIQLNKSVLAIKYNAEDELPGDLKGMKNLTIFNFYRTSASK